MTEFDMTHDKELLFNEAVPIERIDASLERKSEFVHVSVKFNKERILLLQLTSESDYTLLYSLEITFEEFQLLKNEQNLLVDFLQFPLKFIELLKEVQRAHRQEVPKFICRLRSDNPKPAAFSIIETNSFRNIIHISLLFKPGNDSALKIYLAGLVKEFKELSCELQDKLVKTSLAKDKKEKEYAALVENSSMEYDKLKTKSQEQLNSLELEYTRKISDQKSEFLKEREELTVKKEVVLRDLELKYSEIVNKLTEKSNRLKENNTHLAEKVGNLTNALELAEKEKVRLELDLLTAKREQERQGYSLEELQRARVGLADENSRLLLSVQKLEKRERDLSDSCRVGDERILSFQEKIVSNNSITR
jgi:spindle assembly abnormal protein 6